MTGCPGIPPGWIVFKCWTDWDSRVVVAKKNNVTAEMNNRIAPRKSFLQRQNRKSNIELRGGIFCSVKNKIACGQRLNLSCCILAKNCPIDGLDAIIRRFIISRLYLNGGTFIMSED
jgi:hypothetical protein